MFSNLILPDADIAEREAELRTGFAASGRAGTFEANAIRIVGGRMLKRPMDYVEFGPYWWAVKRVLNAAGYDFGQTGDAAVAEVYRGDTDTRTLVAGEIFKDYYRETYFAGTAEFDLTGDGETYALEDPDMAQRVALEA